MTAWAQVVGGELSKASGSALYTWGAWPARLRARAHGMAHAHAQAHMVQLTWTRARVHARLPGAENAWPSAHARDRTAPVLVPPFVYLQVARLKMELSLASKARDDLEGKVSELEAHNMSLRAEVRTHGRRGVCVCVCVRGGGEAWRERRGTA